MEICQFMRFKFRVGGYTNWAAQNFYINETKDYGGISYQFLPIAVAGGSGTSSGSRSEAVLATGINELTLNVFSEAAESDWLLEVKTVKVNRADFSLGALLQDELWVAQQVQHEDGDPIVKLQLSSPLDAVRGRGGRSLSQVLVGALPVSGALVIQ